MARDTDFLDLYKILEVQPGCELDEFKQAYRRRVVVLHPDRQSNGHPDMIAAERLQRLNALYGAAMTFQRQHGRLPGAAQPRAVRPGTVPRATQAMVSGAPRRNSRRLLVLLGAVVVGWLLWNAHPTSNPADPGSPSAQPNIQPAHHAARPAADEEPQDAGVQLIRSGTPADTVRRIEGEPLIISDDRWEYGPSWILFEHGRVVNWYSSPVRPLRTATGASAPP